MERSPFSKQAVGQLEARPLKANDSMLLMADWCVSGGPPRVFTEPSLTADVAPQQPLIANEHECG